MTLLQQLERRKIFVALTCLALLLFIISSSSTSTSTSSSSLLRHADKHDVMGGAHREYTLVNATKDACTRTIEHQKTLLFDTFSQAFEGVHNVALISMPDHENK